MSRLCAGLLLVFTLASCGKSGDGPTAVVTPPVDPAAVLVSANPNAHPHYLCAGVADAVDLDLVGDAVTQVMRMVIGVRRDQHGRRIDGRRDDSSRAIPGLAAGGERED